jgi:hypothetical protein
VKPPIGLQETVPTERATLLRKDGPTESSRPKPPP